MNFSKVFGIIAAALIMLLAVGISISPYRYDKHYGHLAVSHSVSIEAPISKVYEYLGNSDNARHWSVFVNHITPLNPNEVSDGEVESIRRCFTKKDETGATWDEKIIVAEAQKRRRLSLFNMTNFSFTSEHLLTEQIYGETGGETILTLSLFVDPDNATIMDYIKLYIVSFSVSEKFEKNLYNLQGILKNY